MVSPSFVMSAYVVKDDKTRRNVDYRRTKLRYLIVVIACLVVFGCEYCFDTASVPLPSLRPCRPRSSRTTTRPTPIAP